MPFFPVTRARDLDDSATAHGARCVVAITAQANMYISSCFFGRRTEEHGNLMSRNISNVLALSTLIKPYAPCQLIPGE